MKQLVLFIIMLVSVSAIGQTNQDTIQMYIEEKTFVAGEEVTLDVWTDQLDGLAAWQLRLNFENAEILNITEGSPFIDIPSNIINDNQTINTIWLPADVISVDVPSNETWFTLTVLPSVDGSTFDIFTTENDPWSEIVLEDSLDISGLSVDFSFQIEEREFLVSNEDVETNELLIKNNPVSDRLILSGLNDGSSFTQLSVFTLDGSTVLTKSIEIIGNQIELDIANLKSGFYFLNMSGAKSQTIKFLKI